MATEQKQKDGKVLQEVKFQEVLHLHQSLLATLYVLNFQPSLVHRGPTNLCRS